VDLLSRLNGSFIKPNYRFMVCVWGEAPYAFVRQYEVISHSDDGAAHVGMELFQMEARQMPFALAI
jgi:hypothetical protein